MSLHKLFLRIKDLLKAMMGKVSIVNIMPVSFVGWKMATGTRPPWQDGGGNTVSRMFASCDAELRALVASKQIVLTQFRPNAVDKEVADLRWRHYFVYWSANYAICNSRTEIKNFAEIGVCDGLTAWYASRVVREAAVKGEFYLYDAWEGMRGDLLCTSEKGSTGSYAYLEIDNTRKNLEFTFQKNFVFNKGYVPDSFTTSNNPSALVWLHIDLNSALPTIASLDFFWDRLEPGGVVLLDDFAWPGYEETQNRVEQWSNSKQIPIMHLPTGQAMLFK